MARLKAFRGNLMVHKHRGSRWTVRVRDDNDDEVFNWLSDNYNEEDFENGPWARISNSIWNNYSTYDITSKEIVTMMALRWS
jgi:hypothetical protein